MNYSFKEMHLVFISALIILFLSSCDSGLKKDLINGYKIPSLTKCMEQPIKGKDFVIQKFILKVDTISAYIGQNPKLPGIVEAYITEPSIFENDHGKLEYDSLYFLFKGKEYYFSPYPQLMHEKQDLSLIEREIHEDPYSTYFLQRDQFNIWLCLTHQKNSFHSQIILEEKDKFIQFMFPEVTYDNKEEMCNIITEIEKVKTPS